MCFHFGDKGGHLTDFDVETFDLVLLFDDGDKMQTQDARRQIKDTFVKTILLKMKWKTSLKKERKTRYDKKTLNE